MPERLDAVIAGVNKAGTTSLFVSLSAHPDVAPSAIKETGYFLPPRWGEPLEPFSAYQELFRDAGTRPVHLEATPNYFYGGGAVAQEIATRLVDPHVVVVLREPVQRAVSFFKYQKVRLRFPADLPIDGYLAEADRFGPDDFRTPEHERYRAFQGGCYADHLPDWLDAFGPRLRIVWFEDLVGAPEATLASVAAFLRLDPARLPSEDLSSENRTTGFRSAQLQRLALGGNDRLERVLRRHPSTKRRLRALYYRVNGRAPDEVIPEHVLDDLAARYAEPNRRLAGQLDAAGLDRPSWLDDVRPAERA